MNEINKFIAGLSDFQKKLLIVTIIIVVAAIFDRLLIDPTISHLSLIKQDIAKEEAIIKQDLRFLKYKDRIVKETKEIDPYLTKNIKSDNEMIASFLNMLSTE